MKLTGNEKRILKLLLDNSRISDKDIAKRLNITSQAVGKIRKKLESSFIDSYTVKIDCCKLGVKLFAMTLSRLTERGVEKGEAGVERILRETPYVIHAYRLTSGTSDYIIMYGFRDMDEMDRFFRSNEMKSRFHSLMHNQEIFTFPHSSFIKNSPMQLFSKIIEEEPGIKAEF